jgi:hypothetical protein
MSEAALKQVGKPFVAVLFVLLLFLIGLTQPSRCVGPEAKKELEVGRYDLVTTGTAESYLIDTSAGRVWSGYAESDQWIDLKVPIKLAAEDKPVVGRFQLRCLNSKDGALLNVFDTATGRLWVGISGDPPLPGPRVARVAREAPGPLPPPPRSKFEWREQQPPKPSKP